MRTAALVLMLAAAAAAYDGKKYRGDPRLARIVKTLPEQRARARRELGRMLGVEVPDFAVRIEDAGSDRSGVQAETRLVAGKPMVVLRAEFLVLGSIDVAQTLRHEFFHCLHRARLGEARYARVPVWAREGAALFVAGQAAARAEDLAALIARDPLATRPLERLLDGLAGPHDFYDYYEDVAGFLALGRARGLALVRKLLDTPDPAQAIGAVTGQGLQAFERAAQAHARKVLAPLLERGRDVLPADRAYFMARDKYDSGRFAAARMLLRNATGRTTTRAEAILLRLRLMKAQRSPEFSPELDRALKDLEPFELYADVLRLNASRAGTR